MCIVNEWLDSGESSTSGGEIPLLIDKSKFDSRRVRVQVSRRCGKRRRNEGLWLGKGVQWPVQGHGRRIDVDGIARSSGRHRNYSVTIARVACKSGLTEDVRPGREASGTELERRWETGPCAPVDRLGAGVLVRRSIDGRRRVNGRGRRRGTRRRLVDESAGALLCD